MALTIFQNILKTNFKHMKNLLILSLLVLLNSCLKSYNCETIVKEYTVVKSNTTDSLKRDSLMKDYKSRYPYCEKQFR